MEAQGAGGTVLAEKAVSWRVRKGTPADYPIISDLLAKVYGPATAKSAQAIRWLYEANPAGSCLLWVAEEESTGRVVSVNPMFPWRVSVKGREVLTAQAGDAATDPDFQGRGIWGALVKAAWLELRAQGMTFTFSFPNPGALSVFKKTTPKVGIGPRAGSYDVLHLRRMTCPLSLRVGAGRIPGGEVIARLFDPAFAAYLATRLRLPRSMTLAPVVRFDESFDELWRTVGSEYGALFVRDSRHLNWRFMDAPSRAFRGLALFDRDRLTGYVIWEVDGQGDGWIVDLLCRPDQHIFSILLKGTLLTLRRAGCAKVSTWMAEENPLYGVARSVGLIPRKGTFPMAVHLLEDGPQADTLLDPRQWWAWFGDRDVERLAEDPVAETGGMR